MATWASRPGGGQSERAPQCRKNVTVPDGGSAIDGLGEESVELGEGVLDDPVVGHGDAGRVCGVVAIGAELGSGVVECCLTVGAH